ncbi:CBS domain-containing protein [Roseomonas eburnea]|uniref:CBS domain-containing protein n=1 Tax=Neoroseomonas eburnea TaxID=1346889 RepID=A0A9X9XHH8_9PROT|nr:CBS domain-containing protein [Neoroseomonas eburnea]MBR0683164.1 CBS domain-containing protein [Neoroseomonas eburnea]
MPQRTMGEIVRDQKPLTLAPTATVSEACAAMYARKVGAVLVVDEDRHLLGIFTGRDAVRLLAEGLDAKATRIDAVMTKNPTTLGPRATAMDALLLLNDCGFRHVPIVEGGHVVGIVSRYDFRAREHARLDDESGFMEVMR